MLPSVAGPAGPDNPQAVKGKEGHQTLQGREPPFVPLAIKASGISFRIALSTIEPQKKLGGPGDCKPYGEQCSSQGGPDEYDWQEDTDSQQGRKGPQGLLPAKQPTGEELETGEAEDQQGKNETGIDTKLHQEAVSCLQNISHCLCIPPKLQRGDEEISLDSKLPIPFPNIHEQER